MKLRMNLLCALLLYTSIYSNPNEDKLNLGLQEEWTVGKGDNYTSSKEYYSYVLKNSLNQNQTNATEFQHAICQFRTNKWEVLSDVINDNIITFLLKKVEDPTEYSSRCQNLLSEVKRKYLFTGDIVLLRHSYNFAQSNLDGCLDKSLKEKDFDTCFDIQKRLEKLIAAAKELNIYREEDLDEVLLDASKVISEALLTHQMDEMPLDDSNLLSGCIEV